MSVPAVQVPLPPFSRKLEFQQKDLANQQNRYVPIFNSAARYFIGLRGGGVDCRMQKLKQVNPSVNPRLTGASHLGTKCLVLTQWKVEFPNKSTFHDMYKQELTRQSLASLQTWTISYPKWLIIDIMIQKLVLQKVF